MEPAGQQVPQPGEPSTSEARPLAAVERGAGQPQPSSGEPQPSSGEPQPLPGQQPSIRVGDRERDAVAHRLQEAFAEGRLDDEEFDLRMRAALTAKLSSDLEVLTKDLPSGATIRQPATPPAQGPKPGSVAISYKSSIRRAGRWRVPERFKAVVYKGSGWIDLRAAELTAPTTTLLAIAYKSRIDVLVPVGVRVELDGIGINKAWSAEEELEVHLPADAPVVHIRGVGYKGVVEVSTKPQEISDPSRRSLTR